jgi:hypothetical protein
MNKHPEFFVSPQVVIKGFKNTPSIATQQVSYLYAQRLLILQDVYTTIGKRLYPFYTGRNTVRNGASAIIFLNIYRQGTHGGKSILSSTFIGSVAG